MIVLSLAIFCLLVAKTSASEKIVIDECRIPPAPIADPSLHDDLEPDEKIYKEPSLVLSFDRDSLAVTNYTGTPSVNFVIHSSMVEITDGSVKERVITEITGVANVHHVDNRFRDCVTFVRSNDTGSYFVRPRNLNKAFDECVASAICHSLGELQPEDLARANDEVYFFGPISLKQRSTATLFRNLYPMRPDLADVPLKYRHLQNASYHVVDGLRDLLRSKNAKTRSIPDMYSHQFRALDGSISGLNDVYKEGKIMVMKSDKPGLERFSFSFGMLFGLARYGNVTLVDKPKVSRSMCAKVRDLVFNVDIGLEHGPDYCHFILERLAVEHSGTLDIHACDGDSEDGLDLVQEEFVNEWYTSVAPVLGERFFHLLKIYLGSGMQCAGFKPAGVPR